MKDPICTCPKHTNQQGHVVRAHLDARCPVHGRPVEVPIVQTPELAKEIAKEKPSFNDSQRRSPQGVSDLAAINDDSQNTNPNKSTT